MALRATVALARILADALRALWLGPGGNTANAVWTAELLALRIEGIARILSNFVVLLVGFRCKKGDCESAKRAFSVRHSIPKNPCRLKFSEGALTQLL